MPWIEIVVIAAVLVGVALMAGGRGDGLTAAPPDRPDLLVESQPGPLSAEQVKAARFGVGFRGYRMDEVDALLDRLAAQLPSGEATDAGESGATTDAGEVSGAAVASPAADAEPGIEAEPDARGASSSPPDLGPQS